MNLITSFQVLIGIAQNKMSHRLSSQNQTNTSQYCTIFSMLFNLNFFLNYCYDINNKICIDLAWISRIFDDRLSYV